MARILNSPLSAETVTFEYVPSGASTVSTMALSAANFIGGGSGIAYSAGSGISIATNVISLESNIYKKVNSIPSFGSATTTFLANNGTWLTPAGGSGTTYSAGSGISISANTISLESSIYNTVSNLSITNTITSNGTAVPTASAVYGAISNIPQPSIYIFDATRGMGSITLDNSKTMQNIVDAYDDGNNTVYIRIKGIADTNQYLTYRVVFAYNNTLDSTKCTIYTEAIPLSLGSDVGAEMLYYPALSATGDIFQARSLTW